MHRPPASCAEGASACQLAGARAQGRPRLRPFLSSLLTSLGCFSPEEEGGSSGRGWLFLLKGGAGMGRWVGLALVAAGIRIGF